jgi:hypothetical protein
MFLVLVVSVHLQVLVNWGEKNVAQDLPRHILGSTSNSVRNLNYSTAPKPVGSQAEA